MKIKTIIASKVAALDSDVRTGGGTDATDALQAALESESLLVVPKLAGLHPADQIPDVVLTGKWSQVKTLTEQTNGSKISLRADGKFPTVPAGIYKMD
jgi:hypothetical protein